MTPSSESLSLIKYQRLGVIYVARNRVNGKLYVGQTTKKLYKRKCDHVNDAERGYGHVFHAAIKKYGKDAFEWDTLQICYGRNCLNEAEKWWIRNLRSMVPNGYNLTTGGEGALDSEETKKRKSEAFKRWSTPEQRKEWAEKAHDALRGGKWAPGRRETQKYNVTPEVIERRRAGQLRNPYIASEEARKKISAAKMGKPNLGVKGKKFPGRGKGRIFSEEHKQHMADAKRGKPRPDMIGHTWNVGRKNGPLSEDHKRKVGEANKRHAAERKAKRDADAGQTRLNFG